MNGGVSLVIPVEGLFDVYHYYDDIDTDPDYAKKVLGHRAEGTLISLNIVVAGETGGKVAFLHDPTGPVNSRAREALAHLTGVHMIFTGPVLFTGISEEKINEVVSTRLGFHGGNHD